MGNSSANRQISEANAEKRGYKAEISNFQYGQSTGGLDNPYGAVTNAQAGLSNEFANQRVATGAAEFQAQQQDQSQANILDAIVQGGGGAGANATALAQQAAQSNQQISAGLQQQETANQQASAQGAQRVGELQAQGEAQRQQLFGVGQQYTLGLQEARDTSELAGLGNLYAGAQQSANAGYQAKAANQQALIKGAFSLAGAATKALIPTP